MSPLMQIAKLPKQAHPNIRTDAMFPVKAFDAFVDLVAKAGQRRILDGRPEEIYEPLDHIEAGLPPMLIHVSGSEVLLHDARLAAQRLADVGVPVQLRVWPAQMHVFQIAAPMVPEANRSLSQIGNYIREATDPYRRMAFRTARDRAPRACRGVIADSSSNRLPPSIIHCRTGDS
jgi:acetyl esterase/lipase